MEINMKNITKVGLSALAGTLAFTSANAGDVSISGSMITSYTKKGGYNTTANPLGMSKALTVTASGELDNGVSVAYKQTITDAMGYNDSELVFTGVPMLGDATLAMTSTGSPLDAIDDKTPIAFEEANAGVGSIKDVSGVNGTYGLRYTLADMMGTGITLDAMYVYSHGSGDAAAEKGSDAGTPGNEDGYDIVLSGAVPGVDGLDFGVGYSTKTFDAHATTGVDDLDQHEGTAYLTYAVGSLKFGAQRSVVENPGTTATASDTTYLTDYLGISYSVSDNLSLSYNEIEGNKSAGGVNVDQDIDSVSLSYTSGGMTIGIMDQDASNASYTSTRKQTARAIQMTVAF
jgi:hypothetical protein